MTSVILSVGMKMRDEHGMLREVSTFCHYFCHTFRWCENEGRAWKGEGGIHFFVMTSVILSHFLSWYSSSPRNWFGVGIGGLGSTCKVFPAITKVLNCCLVYVWTMYTSLSIPCSSFIFIPPESMTEVMTKMYTSLSIPCSTFTFIPHESIHEQRQKNGT